MPQPIGRTTRSRWRACWTPSRCSSRPSAGMPSGRLRSSSRGAGNSDTRSVTCAFAADKERQQLVEEEPPALGRAQALPVTLDQALVLGFVELALDCGDRQAGALLEERERESFGETQRVQHELERQLGGRHGALPGDGDRSAHVVARLLDALMTRHAIGEAHLAVRAGADAEGVAELPVVQGVPAAMPGAGGGRGVLAAITPP